MLLITLAMTFNFLLLLLLILLSTILMVDPLFESLPVKLFLRFLDSFFQISELLLLSFGFPYAERSIAFALFARDLGQSIEEWILIINHLRIDLVGLSRLDVDEIWCEYAVIIVEYI